MLLKIRVKIIFTTFLFLIANQSGAQHTSVPETIDTKATYLIYLHGGVVQDQGRNAVSVYYGAYLYDAILDSLQKQGFVVISEVRNRNTSDSVYALNVSSQVETLVSKGVESNKIVIVGASAGAYIAIDASKILKQTNVKYVLLGLCSNYAIDFYAKDPTKMIGNFLSIYETTDSKKSCLSIFKNLNNGSKFMEIALDMGIDHAFLFKPYPEWVNPMSNWIKNN